MTANNNAAPLTKAVVNSNGNITIGHYILGNVLMISVR